MAFDDLPPLPPLLHPGANEYAETALAETRRVQAAARVATDLRYGRDYWQRLDVYMPPARAGDHLPVLIFFHGGAWTNGTKEWMGFMAPPILSMPALFVAPNYRLAPTDRFPKPLDDCCEALAWVWRNIGSFGGDPERIFLGGHSAGGHLAALAALSSSRLADRNLPRDVVRACFPVSGSFDLRSRDAPAGSMERRIYDVFLERPEDDVAASPLALVPDGRVPFLLSWGERDFSRLITQGEAMHRALQRQNVEVASVVLPDCDHFGANLACAAPSGPWFPKVRRWMDVGQTKRSSP